MATKTNNILLLGAGMVSAPFVEYFARKKGVTVTVATRSADNGRRLVRIGPNVDLVIADVATEAGLSVIQKLIGKADLCVSLLPYIYHVTIAKMCIQKRTNMLTSSYLSPELQALDEAAKSAGIIIMNECGLDPGIDHLLAMECIDSIHAAGGKVKSFVSFCGGLPAPEVSDNALRYKFSWSPKGMLLALLNPAKYLLNGRMVEVEGDGGVLDRLYPIQFMPGFSFVGYPNRDSTKYADIYGIAGECQTLLRGTLRFQGFVEAIKALKAVGYISTKDGQQQQNATWRQISAKLLGQPQDASSERLKAVMAERLQFEGKEKGIGAIEQLGLLSDTTIAAPGHGQPEGTTTLIDALAHHLAGTLKYGEGERDLVVLVHELEALLPDGKIERHRVSLTAYGEPNGYSAMARTVGYTTAIVAQMMLRGEIREKGMLRPVRREVYEPVLNGLDKEFGIRAITTTSMTTTKNGKL